MGYWLLKLGKGKCLMISFIRNVETQHIASLHVYMVLFVVETFHETSLHGGKITHTKSIPQRKSELRRRGSYRLRPARRIRGYRG